MLDILRLRPCHGSLRGIPEDVVVKVAVVVNLMNELVHARRRVSRAALEWLRTDDLAVVDNELLVEGGFWG